MKKDIHPDNYRDVIFLDTSSGEKFLIGSTVQTTQTDTWEDGKEYPLYEVEISSSSHPFYTGQFKVLDTAGRVEKFKARQKHAQENVKNKKQKKREKTEKKEFEEGATKDTETMQTTPAQDQEMKPQNRDEKIAQNETKENLSQEDIISEAQGEEVKTENTEEETAAKVDIAEDNQNEPSKEDNGKDIEKEAEEKNS